MQAEAREKILQSNLSDEQKKSSSNYNESTNKQVQELRDESLKLRSLLIQSVLAPKYDRNEVMAIQRKIKKAENKRLAVMFDAVDKTNGILGRPTRAEADQRMVDQMIIMDRDWLY